VSGIKYSDGTNISYSYDDKGNIVAIYENNSLTERYTYDSLNQLVREDSAKSGTTTTYSYDNGGNILETKKYAYTEGELGDVISTNTYTYSDSEWKDLLTAYNGQTITYDEIGNPLSYRDGFNFTWKNGRQLSTLQNGDNVVNYTYNSNGIRTSKAVNGVRTDYTLNNTTIVAETTNGKTTWYDYDASGMPIGFTTDEQSYYYKKNAQGDIVAILDSNGVELASYTYDAWGNVTSVSGDEDLAENNPFRYRGYYQDSESGFFYLQSRYYDGVVGRFLNADHIGIPILTQGQILNANLFAYCMNNPIIYSDHTGYVSMGAIIGGIIGLGVGAILIPAIADSWGLKGWKRTVFITGGVTAVTAIGALLGHYAGKALVALYAKGGVFAKQLNTAVAKVIGKFTGASVKAASGNGWTLTLKKYTVRIMTEGGGRVNYFRLSHATKGAMTITGAFSQNRAITHIAINAQNLFKLINLMLGWK